MQKLSGIPLKKVLIILAILISAALIIIAGFFVMNRQKNIGAGQGTQAEIKEITDKVSKLMDLPKDETPAMATVSDVTKLAGQDFFKNAKNGDKVIAYTKNKKAIIYRPSDNKIIEVAFYNPPVAEKAPASGSAQLVAGDSIAPTKSAEKVRVVVYNGTKTAGLAKSRGAEIAESYSQVEIASTANAAADFEETLVIDITGKNKTLISNIAKSLVGKVDSMPRGEVKPDADILVILGSK